MDLPNEFLIKIYESPPRRRRLYAAVAGSFLLCVIAILLWVTASIPLSAYQTLFQQRVYLGRLHAVLQTSAPTASNGTSDTRLEKMFLRGKNAEVVSAELQTWLDGAAEEARIQLQSVERIPLRMEEKLQYLGLSADFVASWEEVLRFVQKVEGEQPMLFIRDLEIQPAYEASDEAEEPQFQVRIGFVGAVLFDDIKGSLE